MRRFVISLFLPGFQHYKSDFLKETVSTVRRGNAMYIVALFHNKRWKRSVFCFVAVVWKYLVSALFDLKQHFSNKIKSDCERWCIRYVVLLLLKQPRRLSHSSPYLVIYIGARLFDSQLAFSEPLNITKCAIGLLIKAERKSLIPINCLLFFPQFHFYFVLAVTFIYLNV